MKLRSVFLVVCPLILALAITAGLPSPASAQQAEKAGQTRLDSLHARREAYSAKAREWQDDTTSARTGWLILDGRSVSGPYEVVVVQEDSTILVNGIIAISPAPQPESIEPDPTDIACHTVIEKMGKGYDSVYTEKGTAVAQRWAFEFLREQPVVDSVYYSKWGELAIKFVDHEYPMYVVPPPPGEKPPTPVEMEEMFKENLQSMADRLRGSLSHGSLVIKGSRSWGGTTISYPQSRFIMEELEKITTSISDLDKRVAAIKEILGNDDQVQLIAERFKVEQAEVEK